MKHLINIFLIFTCTAIYAQKYKLVATEQSWSGGICCRSGVNYHISIRTSNEAYKIMSIDSVSINNNFFYGKDVTINSQVLNDSVYIELDFQSVQDEYKYYEGPDLETKTHQIHKNTPMVYARIRLEKINFEIREVKTLPYLAYP